MKSYELVLSDEARLDIFDAFYWYDQIDTKLSASLEKCLEAGFNAITDNPQNYQKRYKSLRIYFISKFPYGIHYLIDADTIRVFGVFHTSRNPKSWIGRL